MEQHLGVTERENTPIQNSVPRESLFQESMSKTDILGPTHLQQSATVRPRTGNPQAEGNDGQGDTLI